MPIIVTDIEQRSDAWSAARAGIPSASCFDQIVTSKGEPSKQAAKYMRTLAGERLIGTKEETYQSAAMLRGMEMEGEAREYYKFRKMAEVREVGLVYQDERKLWSCSPDGLTGDRGLEIKCPQLHTHVDYLLRGKLPADYFQQVQGSMMICDMERWDFLSYYPKMPQLLITVHRDDEFCRKLRDALEAFCAGLEEMERRLMEGA